MSRNALLFVVLVGCSPGADPCVPMCAQAAEVYGECLEGEWDTDWAAAGYDDAADFASGCETYTWELRLLDEDAGGDGTSVDAMCRDRDRVLDSLSCDEWTELTWDDTP